MTKRTVTSSPESLVVKSVVLQPFISQLEASGAPADRLIGACGLSRELLDTPDSLASMRKIAGLFDRCSQFYGVEHWAVDVGRINSYKDMGAYGAIIERCSTVYEFLARGAQLYSGISNCERFTLVDSSQWVRLYHDFSEGIGPSPVCGTLNAFVLIIRKCQEALGPDWYPKNIGMARPVSGLQQFCPEFAQSTIQHASGRNYIEFERSDLEACFTRALGTSELLSGLDETELDSVPGSLIEIVGQHLGASLASNSVSIQNTACQLNVSVRSLQRRMAEEGLSYRGFLNELRYQISLDKLASEDVSIAELANQLGYKDPANFTRAFRLRSGISPRKFRMQHSAA